MLMLLKKRTNWKRKLPKRKKKDDNKNKNKKKTDTDTHQPEKELEEERQPAEMLEDPNNEPDMNELSLIFGATELKDF